MSAFIRHRRALRRTAAGLCAVIAAVYLAIAAGASGIEPGEEMSLVAFGVGAASIFGVGAILLATLDHRVLWAVGGAVQLGIGAMYVAVSTDRTPAFEAWGLGLRALQIPLLVVLVLLAVRPTRATVPHSAEVTAPTETPPPISRSGT